MNVWQAVLSSLLIVAAQVGVAAEQESQPEATQYLYIETFTVPAGAIPNDVVDEGKTWVRTMRETGDFKSVRLFFHNTGPEVAIYILAEPKSWASIETGFEKLISKLGIMEKPLVWGDHSDNVLAEIPVD